MRLSMAPISGGNWSNSSQAGVWTLNLNNNRTNSNNNVGSRADYEPQIRKRDCGAKGGVFLRASAKSVCHAFFSRSLGSKVKA